MTLRCPACDRYFALNTPECSGCGGPLEKEIFSMLPTTQADDLEEPAPIVRRDQAEFDARLREVTPWAYAAWSLMAANVAVFLVMIASGVSPVDPDVRSLVAWGADFGPLTLAGQGWRALTSTFLHAGIVHLACNMIGILIWGPLVERLYGNGTFLSIYIFSGITGALASLWWQPHVVSVGASGSLLGLVGAMASFLLLHPSALPSTVSRRIGYSIAPVVLYALRNSREGDIDVAAHLGGFIGGLALGALVARPLTAGRPPLAWPRLLAALAVAAGCTLVPYGWLATRPIAESPGAPAASEEVASVTRWFVEEGRRLDGLQIELLGRTPVSETERTRLARRLEQECLEGWQSAVLRLSQTTVRGVGPFPPELWTYAYTKQEELRLIARQLREPGVSLSRELQEVRLRLERLARRP